MIELSPYDGALDLVESLGILTPPPTHHHQWVMIGWVDGQPVSMLQAVEADIQRLAVAPEWQRQGIGRATLLAYATGRDAPEFLRAHVRWDNPAGWACAMAAGFVEYPDDHNDITRAVRRYRDAG